MKIIRQFGDAHHTFELTLQTRDVATHSLCVDHAEDVESAVEAGCSSLAALVASFALDAVAQALLRKLAEWRGAA